MRVLFLDCFAGISGDMFLSSLLDAGLDGKELLKYLKLINIDDYEFTVSSINSHSITGTRVKINVSDIQPHRHLKDIEKMIRQSALPHFIKEKSMVCFRYLAEAEAKVHGLTVDKIHFHEVGAVDSILDIVGAATALYLLKPQKVYCGTLPLGGGYIKCQHGTIPVPAPATVELVKGMPVKMGPVNNELVTPTGAAIVKTFIDEFNLPPMHVDQIGYGFGSRELEIPNALRVLLGTVQKRPSLKKQEINILECNIDDMNPEITSFLQERLLKEGALDVYIQNVGMKKGRPGIEIKVVCEPALREKLIHLIFRESTTLGIRYRTENRFLAQRSIIQVPTPYGKIGVKVSKFDHSSEPQYAPEFEDCKKASLAYDIPLKEIYKLAIREMENSQEQKDSP
ncbi:MAG: nickel pincer cofactor biosynthesis protein LarC [Firmicutes bacterium]|nr:nickel pincer cofactor biosynthesis protein LarC [Bacillota bacterium]